MVSKEIKSPVFTNIPADKKICLDNTNSLDLDFLLCKDAQGLFFDNTEYAKQKGPTDMHGLSYSRLGGIYENALGAWNIIKKEPEKLKGMRGRKDGYVFRTDMIFDRTSIFSKCNDGLVRISRRHLYEFCQAMLYQIKEAAKDCVAKSHIVRQIKEAANTPMMPVATAENRFLDEVLKSGNGHLPAGSVENGTSGALLWGDCFICPDDEKTGHVYKTGADEQNKAIARVLCVYEQDGVPWIAAQDAKGELTYISQKEMYYEYAPCTQAGVPTHKMQSKDDPSFLSDNVDIGDNGLRLPQLNKSAGDKEVVKSAVHDFGMGD